MDGISKANWLLACHGAGEKQSAANSAVDATPVRMMSHSEPTVGKKRRSRSRSPDVISVPSRQKLGVFPVISCASVSPERESIC